MNGEVMEETIETPPERKSDLSGHVQLSEDEGPSGKGEQILCGQKKELNAHEESGIISEMGKEGVLLEDSTIPVPLISEGKTSPSQQMNENVEYKEGTFHVKTLKGLCEEGLQKAPPNISTNGIDKKEVDINIKGSPEPESELENSNSIPEKINNNSKDSSMLSTTDTQDEIDTIDNGDQIFISHLHNQIGNASNNERVKKEVCNN